LGFATHQQAFLDLCLCLASGIDSTSNALFRCFIEENDEIMWAECAFITPHY